MTTSPHMGSQPEENTPPAPIAIYPQLQQVMAALFQTTAAQFQVGIANAQAQAPPRSTPAASHRSRVKTPDPNPNPDSYDRSEPTKVRAFLSHCTLVFRSRPDDFQDDTAKITPTVSWLKGTVRQWYEPNLAIDDCALPDFRDGLGGFQRRLRDHFRRVWSSHLCHVQARQPREERPPTHHKI